MLINKSDIIENVSEKLPDNFLDKYILTSAKEDLSVLENEVIQELGLKPNSELILSLIHI